MSRSITFLFACAALSLGCSVDHAEEGIARSSGDLIEQDVEAVLALVNYPGTDLTVLDVEVGLDRRAAEGIVAHRNGADGVTPSADDVRLDLITLDAIPYVGDSALGKLVTYAKAHPAPAGEQVEGVAFSGWEAEAVVWGVNQASVEELDDRVRLDARAAGNLHDAAPHGSVSGMGPIGYVGASALDALRAYAPVWWTAMHGAEAGLGGTFDSVVFDDATAAIALTIANEATHGELTAHGVISSAATAIVNGREHGTLANVAATSGVGPATMTSLHAYAVSGDWGAAVECDAAITSRFSVPAAQLNELLVLTSTGDWPYAEVITLQASPCLDVTEAGTKDWIVEEILAKRVIDWGFSGTSYLAYLSADDLATGSSQLVSRLDAARDSIEERLADGWTPSNMYQAELLDALPGAYAELTAAPIASPAGYLQTTLLLDNAECSQRAAILVSKTDNSIVIVHTYPGC